MILTHETLKQGQGHLPWYELVDPTQGYIIKQSVKNLAWTVSTQKQTIIFLSNQETHQLSPLSKTVVYDNLLDVSHNPTKFPLYPIDKYHVQLHLFDTTVTLK